MERACLPCQGCLDVEVDRPGDLCDGCANDDTTDLQADDAMERERDDATEARS